MKCPKCGETNKVYFDGAFFKCSTCNLLEWVRGNYKQLESRWKVGEIKADYEKETNNGDK